MATGDEVIIAAAAMAFILTPKNGEKIMINAWNWRPTLELLCNAGLIDDDLHERMGTQCPGAVLDADTATRFADFLEMRLKLMRPGQRIRADLTTTSEPKKLAVFTPETKPEDIDANEIYSATYEWLVQFRDFSRVSGGFEVG